MPPLKNLAITTRKPADEVTKSENETHPTACGICSQEHDANRCTLFDDLQYVKDEPILSRARQSLPKSLAITRMADNTMTIVATQDLRRGTTFGPLRGKRAWAMNPMSNIPIKVFVKGQFKNYYLDHSDEQYSNWMCFVCAASNAREQNLVCYQRDRDIFYTAMRSISAGEELRVWYSPPYALKMEMPLYNLEFANVGENLLAQAKTNTTIKTENGENIQKIAERLPAKNLGAPKDKEDWNCRICSIAIPSVVAYAKHLMEHYKPLLGVFCDICNKKFHRLTVLQKHKRLEHPEAASSSDVVGIPTSGNQQQQNAQTILLNMTDSEGQTSEAMKDILEKFKAGNAMTDSSLLLPAILTEKDNPNEMPLLDTNSINVNDLLQNNGALMENPSLKSILENQCLSMSLGLGTMTDSMLSDNIAEVDSAKFNVEELTSELLDIAPEVENITDRMDNLECDICGKKFDKADYLYRHLRKHTGEFICSICLSVFARKENLVTHLCPLRKIEQQVYECLYCQKTFVLKKYLKRHMARHTERNTCRWCHDLFESPTALEAHTCKAPKNVCSQCGKRFVHQAHLNRHAKLHVDPKPAPKRTRKPTLVHKPVICEKCGDVFKNPHTLKQHLRSHGEKKFECDVCHIRFHRIGVLQQHKSTHQTVQIPCQVCGKKLKSKKALDVHVLLHGNKKFHCDKCDKSFFQRVNYLKHYKQVHSEKVIYKCSHCATQFTSESSFSRHMETHVKPAEHACSSCHKVFHRLYQLKRHVQTNHSGIIFRCPFCKMSARYRHSMRRHFERQHKSLSDEWDKPGFVNDLIEKTLPPSVAEQAVSSNPENPDPIGVAYRNVDAEDFQTQETAQGLILSVTGLEENQCAAQTSVPAEKTTDNIVQTSLNGREILLQVAEIRQPESDIESSELTANEVPQLSISDSEANLAESVLGNAYIFGEDGGDIMFYVLDNSSGTITEY